MPQFYFMYVLALLITLNSCQNPSRIQLEHFDAEFERAAALP